MDGHGVIRYTLVECHRRDNSDFKKSKKCYRVQMIELVVDLGYSIVNGNTNVRKWR